MDDQSHEWMLEKLAEEFRGVASRETVDRVLQESFVQLAGARIQTYVTLFAERFTRERLRAIATNEGTILKQVPEVLFVCVHNAGRSQMAAALLDHHAKGRVHVRSAGSAPGDEIHSNVRKAMEEVGLDISKEFPKPLTDEVVRASDVVITMGCGDACPVYPGKRYLDWELEDPANSPSTRSAGSATRSIAGCERCCRNSYQRRAERCTSRFCREVRTWWVERSQPDQVAADQPIRPRVSAWWNVA